MSNIKNKRTMMITYCRNIVLRELFNHRSSDYVKHKLFLLNQKNKDFIEREVRERKKSFEECKKESQMYIRNLYECIYDMLKSANLVKIVLEQSYLEDFISKVENRMKGD